MWRYAKCMLAVNEYIAFFRYICNAKQLDHAVFFFILLTTISFIHSYTRTRIHIHTSTHECMTFIGKSACNERGWHNIVHAIKTVVTPKYNVHNRIVRLFNLFFFLPSTICATIATDLCVYVYVFVWMCWLSGSCYYEKHVSRMNQTFNYCSFEW